MLARVYPFGTLERGTGPRFRLALCGLVLQVLFASACHWPGVPDAPVVLPPVHALTSPGAADPAARANNCLQQAVRFGARGLWQEGSTKRKADVLLRAEAHYSEKHGECNVLIEHRVVLADDTELVYSELWDPFSATFLAAWTGDPRDAIRRSVCQVDLSDDPFVSCRIAKYFIDDRMAH